MSAADFQADDVEVVKEEEITLYRKVIHLASQDRFLSTMESMIRAMRLGKFTGHVSIQLNQGGIKKIESQQEKKKM